MVVEKLLKNAASAEQVITVLTERLASLQRAFGQQQKQREQHEINQLMKQNENLKVQVKNLKFDLECIRVQNGAKSVPLPKKKSANLTPVPAESASPVEVVHTQKEKVKEIIELKKAEKKEVTKENKKGNEKNKSWIKKETKPSEKAASDSACPIDGSRLDLRVGKIVNVERHPDADTLYVEKVDLGEDKPRTIVSGLVNNVKIEELQDRLAIFMCNLKPVKMRGIFSEGMIMCASSPENVKPLIPPNGSVIGDKVRLQGFTEEPDAILNSKKKIWEQIKPDMHVNANGIATYKGREFYVEGKGSCTSPNVRNCPIT